MQLIRYLSSAGTVALGLFAQGQLSGYVAGVSLHELLQLRADAFRARLESSLQAGASDQPALARLLAPIDGDTEVWAAGVTYKRSEEARREGAHRSRVRRIQARRELRRAGRARDLPARQVYV